MVMGAREDFKKFKKYVGKMFKNSLFFDKYHFKLN